jgi:hypothetical protein
MKMSKRSWVNKYYSEHGGRPRKWKWFNRVNAMYHPVEQAWTEGQAVAMFSKDMPPRFKRNPYPPGKRHDAFERGLNTSN